MRVFLIGIISIATIFTISLGVGLYFVFTPSSSSNNVKPPDTTSTMISDVTSTTFDTETSTLTTDSETTATSITSTETTSELTTSETTSTVTESTPTVTETESTSTVTETESTSTVTESTTVTTEITLPACKPTLVCKIPEDASKKLPYYPDCSKYIQCDFFGVAKIEDCPANQHFSPRESKCMSPELAKCPLCEGVIP